MADHIHPQAPVLWARARSLRLPPPDGRPVAFGFQDGRLVGLAPLFEGVLERLPDRELQALLERAEERLGAYLRGERRRLDIPFAPRGTPFQIEVWNQTSRIPYGGTASYKAIAAAIGRSGASRAVGQALGANPLPIVIPCHRVVGSGGRIGGYALGLGVKRFLLDLESGKAGPGGPCDGMRENQMRQTPRGAGSAQATGEAGRAFPGTEEGR